MNTFLFVHSVCKQWATNMFRAYIAYLTSVLLMTGSSSGLWVKAELLCSEWQESRPIRGGTKAFNAVTACSFQSEPPVAGSRTARGNSVCTAPLSHRYIHRYTHRDTGGTRSFFSCRFLQPKTVKMVLSYLPFVFLLGAAVKGE